jgi:hypothetical protein
MSPLDLLHAALEAFGAGDLPGALALCRRAAAMDPASLVLAAAVPYLERVLAQGKQGVYVTGEAFGAFVRGGGNVRLYQATTAALAAAYAELPAGGRLLDVGVGDGLALLPAIDAHVASVTLVEPSGPMLAAATAALTARGVAHDAFHGTLQAFAGARQGERWDLAEATFSLQSIPAAERGPLLAWLRAASPRLLIAEFDVPRFAATLDPARVRHVVERYERGLAEYAGDGGVVAQGFLMPVMFGYFDPTRDRTNEEQPIEAWIDDLRAAGFTRVERRRLDAYWWADACLLDAR